MCSFGGGGGLLSLGLQNSFDSSFTLDFTAAVFMSSGCIVGGGLSRFLEVVSATLWSTSIGLKVLVLDSSSS